MPADRFDEPFEARGNEPGWLLTIDGERMALRWNYGDDEIAVPRPRAEATPDGRRYVASGDGRELRVDVVDALCRDDMSGMPYPSRVTVTIDGETLRGCGGAPESLLTGGEWVVEDIAGRGVVDGSRVTLRFDPGGRLTGRAGCNGYGAAWKLSGEGITVEQPQATLMACASALNRQEQEFLRLLAAAHRFEISDDGALVIHAADGLTIEARRE
ncbi:MAG TPA: META domain-containing protein [Pseudomonadales bacterium]